MYRPSQRQSVFAAHSNVIDLPPLAPPDEEMAVLTAPMIRHMQRDVPGEKKEQTALLARGKTAQKSREAQHTRA